MALAFLWERVANCRGRRADTAEIVDGVGYGIGALACLVGEVDASGRGGMPA